MTATSPKNALSDRLLAKLILFVVFAAIGTGALWLLEVTPARHFRDAAQEVEGRVIASTCDNRGTIGYAYVVEGRSYSGSDQPVDTCDGVSVGERVPVWYLPEAPDQSDLAPTQNLDEAASLAVLAPVFFSAVSVLGLAWRERRRQAAPLGDGNS